jgi:hypothetical protein
MGCGAAQDAAPVTQRGSRATDGSPRQEQTVVAPIDAALPGSDLPSEPFAARGGTSVDGKLFESIDPPVAGVNFRHRASTKPGALRANTVGCGVCIGDYDGDGLADMFIGDSTNGGALFRNLGNFQFEDATERAGLKLHDRWTTGATFVDVDGDGDLDLCLCGFECPNRLYVNQGDGTFVDQAKEMGLDFDGSSTVMAWADYDRDGDLDAYLVTNYLPPPNEIQYRLEMDSVGRPQVPRQYREYHDLVALPGNEFGVVEAGQYDHLYRNDGNLTFTDVTDEAGLRANHKGLGAVWWDYNADGIPDLYVANDFYGPDHLYRNRGDGTFVDEALTALPHTPWFSMGCDLGDVNNDGLIDFIGSDMAGANHYREKMTSGDMEDDSWFLDTADPRQYMRNALYLNTGVGRMIEVAYLAGMSNTDWTWTVKLMDLDQDGWLDLFVTNGMNRDWENSDLHRAALKLGPANSSAYDKFWIDQGRLEEHNLAFRNRGDLQYEEVGAAWGVDFKGVSYGAAFGDLDNDGDLDFVVNNMDDKPSLYRNSQTTGHGIEVRLKGVGKNPWAVGATLTIVSGGMTQTRYVTPVRGFMSGDDLKVHFGLGQLEKVESLVVAWPDGSRDAYRELAADRIYTITRNADSDAHPPNDSRPPRNPWFHPSRRILAAIHRERPFDDFAQQKLLPRQLSQLGPGLAAGDVDGDGRDELLLAGAKGMPCRLLRANDAGEFVLHELFPVWDDDQDRETLGAIFFDADGDSDLDLYATSGGVECPADDPLLRDRLYLNDGHGHFERAAEDSLPDLRDSGGVVAAADFDRDGDLDLFVGGRCVPGAYPTAPKSRLLENRGGRFIDATESAPGLLASGMATGAIWSDANDDGWIDLLVIYDWGPVRIFLNREGRLADATADSGISERIGWWNGIAPGDFDGDGDLDYVVTNYGLNTEYRATPEQPQRLFYGDFEGLGQFELIEASTDEEGRLLPIRGKGAMQQVFTLMAEHFPTYDAYARASVADLVSPEALGEALALSANSLESGVLINDGKARFTFRPLPRLAQAAPSFGCAVSDVDSDGCLDIYLVQNFRGSHREVGHMDGGLSLLLFGDGAGGFRPALPLETGLVVPGDGRSVVVTDLNADGRPDFVVGVNNAHTLGFEHAESGVGRYVSVRLRGPSGNPTGVGAQVRAQLASGATQTTEVSAGGGYLSQDSATLYFGLPKGESVKSIEVRWPDGARSSFPGHEDSLVYELRWTAAEN